MNPSQYNLFFKASDGRFLLLNTSSRSRLFVDDELKTVIENGAFEGVNINIVQQLLKLGVVTEESDESQKFAALYKKRVNTPFEYEFTIIPTFDCNLTCYYCNHSRDTLSKKILQKFTEFFSKELEKGDFENVAVRIAGGEPLLHVKLLFEILEVLSSITEDHGKKFFSALATNGTLLTQEILDKLAFLNAIQLTFEGCRSYHDIIRYDTAGTFDRVLKSAEMIKDAGILLNMRIHVSEKNIAGLKDLFSELHSIIGVGMKFKTMITAAPVIESKICPFYPSRCTETVKVAPMLQKAWEAAKECGLIISGMPHPAYEMLPCPYTTPTSVIVDPSGTFYKCLMGVNDKCAVGSVTEGVLRPDPFTASSMWQDTCKTCPFLVLCGGGCAWRGYQEQNVCGGTRELLMNQVKFYLKNEHPVLE